MRRLPLVALALAGGLAASLCRASAVAVEGRDEVVARLPAGLPVVGYENAGYRLETDGTGRVVVSVEVYPLASNAPFAPRALPGGDGLERLAARLTAGSLTRYQAVTRVLSWVGSNVRYRLDRGEPQDAHSVLGRRTAYCTGMARLAVALLAAVGIEAREVPGYVLAATGGGGPAGFHRWIEVFYPDRGWVFSDPAHSYHFVPATYVRLAAETVDTGAAAGPASLVERERRLGAVDVVPGLPPDVTVRKNEARQLAAVLNVEVGSGGWGRAVLEGEGRRLSGTILDGGCTFLDLQPGVYNLRLTLRDRPTVDRRVRVEGAMRTSLHLESAGFMEQGGESR